MRCRRALTRLALATGIAAFTSGVGSVCFAQSDAMPAPTVAPSAPDEPDAHPYGRSDVLLAVALGFGITHHVDHFLSESHPDFPFGAHSVPLTASLAVYPLLVGGYLLDLGPNYSMIVDTVTLGLLIFAHHFVEHDPISEHYDKWADPGPPPDGDGPPHVNAFGTRSPALGVASVTVALGLEISLAGHLTSSIVDGARYGFSWKRRKVTLPSGPRVGAVPCAGFTCIGVAGSF